MNLTRSLLSKLLLFSYLILLTSTCTDTPKKNAQEDSPQTISAQDLPTEPKTTQQGPTITDPRDGEVYAIVSIGEQTWMAENLRYNIPGSQVNPDYPSPQYGRLYDGTRAEKACPEGWHLPSDAEWNEMEMTLGMPPVDSNKIGWRGEHGKKMKSTTNWADEVNGTNDSGFNGLPSGFYYLEASVGGIVFDGYTGSAGYWGAIKGGRAWIRFLGAPLAGVNRMEDSTLEWGLACRCVKD